MSHPPDDPTRPSTMPDWTPPGPQQPQPGWSPQEPPPAWAPQGPQPAWAYQGAPPPTPEPVTRSGPSVRWALAAAVTAIVLVAGVALAFFATSGQRGPAFGPEFLPRDTLGFVEIRLDLPADQRANAVEFMSKFPGWADGAAFDTKIHSTLDDLASNISQGRLLPSRDIAPWFDGRVFLGTTDLPADPTDAAAFARSYVAGVGVKDRVQLQATIDRFRAESPGSTFSEQAHGTSTIVTATLAGQPVGSVSWAVTDPVLLVALDPAPIREVLDVMAGTTPRLGDEAAFRQVYDRVPAGRLGAAYTNVALMRPFLGQQIQVMRDQMGGSEILGLGNMMDAYLDGIAAAYEMVPDHLVQVVTVSGDHLTADMFGSPGPRTPTLSVRHTGLAARMPVDSMVYLEIRDVGTTIHNATEWGLSMAGDALPADQLEQVEAFLGTPLEDYFTFVQDVAVAGSFDGQKLHFGLAATLTDEALATERVNRLVSTIRLAAAAGAGPIEVTETDVGGVTVTTISITDQTGATALPIDTSVSIAVGQGVLLIGSGDFADEALQRDEAGSLAGDARFKGALSAAGDPNAAILYVDLASIKTAIETVAPANVDYQTNIKPYLDPLDRFVIVVNSSSDLLSLRTQLFVK